jgi:hypothetical protein
MMGGFSNTITGGGGSLVRPSIHSPNYVPGVSGWSINRDGTAEFAGGQFRGAVIIGGPAPATPEMLLSVQSGIPTISMFTGNASETAPGTLQSVGSGVLVTSLISPTDFVGIPTDRAYLVLRKNLGSFSDIELTTDRVLFDTYLGTTTTPDIFYGGRSQGRGMQWVTSSTNLAVGPAAGEQILYTAASFDYLAGRCYELCYSFLGATAAAGDVTITIRKGTTVAGAQLAGERTGTPVAGRAETCRGWPRIRNATGATVTTQVLISAQANAGNGTFTSTTASVGRFECWDIGAAADFPSEPQI